MTGVSTIESPPLPATPSRYTVTLARDEDDVRAAQRLRHDVFAGELGALLSSPQPGLDIDPFDAYCDHLLVRDTLTGQVVGTYRLLPPERAAVAGRLYSEGEFDLARLDAIRPGLVEVGRSCVHPEHRTAPSSASSGPGSPATWSTAATNGWPAAARSRSPTAAHSPPAPGTAYGRRTCAPEEFRVTPPPALVPPTASTRPAGRTELPPLLRGYLRLGAWVCGEPAHDPDFGVADLYVLLSMRRINPRYLRHFLSLVPA